MKYSDTINFVNRDDKKLLGGIQMNTKTFEQFDVMTDAELAKVEGGNVVTNTAGAAIAGGVVGAGVCSASVAFAPFAGACAYVGAKAFASGYLIAHYS